MYKSFRDMRVWQNALGLSDIVFKLTLTLPKSEDYGLTSQIRRSSNSISGNIAEAFGRKQNKDKSRFYHIARGSAFETQSHLLYGAKIEYFNENAIENVFKDYQELIHEINKILKSLE
ncbi:MAG: four helix bundle protein [Bacteroidetes bacterium]|nr:MAG: four helix bundle protein [Bacteroidota bacterium]